MSRFRGLQTAAASFAAGAAAGLWVQPGGILVVAGLVASSVSAAAGFVPAAFAAAGWVAAGISSPPGERSPPAPGSVTIRGTVASMPRRGGDDRVRWVVNAGEAGRLEVSTPDLPLPLAPGDRVLLSAELRDPRPPRNPGGRDGSALARAHGIQA